MKEITLTQGKIALVDDEDFERLNQYSWCAISQDHRWYAARGVFIENKWKTMLMHREIMNASNGVKIDHRNSHGLDNQKYNLRVATSQQNAQNIKNSHKDNKYKIKGVSWNRQHKKFEARIRVNGKKLLLGLFNVLGDADSAYRIAEEKYFGEFTRGNILLLTK